MFSRVALAVCLGVLVHTGRAGACSCLPGTSIEGAFDAAHAVVEAQVAEVRGGGPPGKEHRVVLEVKRSHKGPGGARLEVITAAETATCGYPFERGKDYLVYIHRDQDDLAVGLCSRTRPLAEAGEDLQMLAKTSTQRDGLPARERPPGTGGTQGVPQVDVSGRPVASEGDHQPRRGGCAGCAHASSDPTTLRWSLLLATLLSAAALRRRLDTI